MNDLDQELRELFEEDLGGAPLALPVADIGRRVRRRQLRTAGIAVGCTLLLTVGVIAGLDVARPRADRPGGSPSGGSPSGSVGGVSEVPVGSFRVFGSLWSLTAMKTDDQECVGFQREPQGGGAGGCGDSSYVSLATNNGPDAYVFASGIAPTEAAAVAVVTDDGRRFEGLIFPPGTSGFENPLWIAALGDGGKGKVVFEDSAGASLLSLDVSWDDNGQGAQPVMTALDLPVVVASGTDGLAGGWELSLQWIDPENAIMRLAPGYASAIVSVTPQGYLDAPALFVTGGSPALLMSDSSEGVVVASGIVPLGSTVVIRLADGSKLPVQPLFLGLEEHAGIQSFFASFPLPPFPDEGETFEPWGTIRVSDQNGTELLREPFPR